MAASCATTAALNCNGTLIAIVQCIASSCDVPLLALHALLSRPAQFLHAWPKPSFDGLVDNQEALVRTALHVYEAVDVHDVHGFGPNFATCASTAPFGTFVSKWAPKITSMDLSISTERLDETICDALRQCTRLREVWLGASPMTTSLFQAVTTPAHHVRKLHIHTFRDYPLDWTPLVTSWLATGHANFLSLSGITPPNDQLARAIVSLRGLEVYSLDAFVQQLFALDVSLRHLTSVGLHTDVPAHIAKLLQLVDIPRLESLMLSCPMPLDPLVQYLHAAPRLEELDLRRCTLTITNEPVEEGTWPRLRIARFGDVNFGPDAFQSVLTHLSTSDRLEHVSFINCRIVGSQMEAMSAELAIWIEKGLRPLTLRDNFLDEASVALIASALNNADNSAPLTLELTENYSTISSVWDFSQPSRIVPMWLCS
ncbi:hypothetical protein SDRG_15718 [Saprolegnia diclina VS20]|uniref:F-box domain-containing protein n=1 Tax=Saprolegnia diclina (strain VS20) TaxID=1156394 RepID=T0RA96_SAPDV|nr:hypothetical protein SDRG_15718 [Saprolegnia diclina VS20]EQC26437.1 hypothetical protein SDRG_15718 [Saprolegnia diclina VS20]|eukprot:XP_008620122.1 hypothetical protein SDRG_15718 [Saprolegnia diclina VS20]